MYLLPDTQRISADIILLHCCALGISTDSIILYFVPAQNCKIWTSIPRKIGEDDPAQPSSAPGSIIRSGQYWCRKAGSNRPIILVLAKVSDKRTIVRSRQYGLRMQACGGQ
eukprot:111527-Rhodomonas_salina.2